MDEIIASQGRPEDNRVAQLEEEVKRLKQVEVNKTDVAKAHAVLAPGQPMEKGCAQGRN